MGKSRLERLNAVELMSKMMRNGIKDDVMRARRANMRLGYELFQASSTGEALYY